MGFLLLFYTYIRVSHSSVLLSLNAAGSPLINHFSCFSTVTGKFRELQTFGMTVPHSEADREHTPLVIKIPTTGAITVIVPTTANAHVAVAVVAVTVLMTLRTVTEVDAKVKMHTIHGQ